MIVVRNLITRNPKLVTEPNDTVTEMNLLIPMLKINTYSVNVIKRIIKNEDQDEINGSVKQKESVSIVVIPYCEGISEEIRKILTL